MKNKYEIRGDITAIFLNSPKFGDMETIISTFQLERAMEFKNTWYAAYNPKTKTFYVMGNITTSLNKRRVYGIHQWLKGLPELFVDHINHNTLDNTNENMRLVSNSENMQNRKSAARHNITGIRGVAWVKKRQKWQVRMKINGVEIFLGMYESLEEAEKVAKEARSKHMPFSQEAVS